MDIKQLLEIKYTPQPIIKGKPYPEKPDDAKSLTQWLKNGKKPIELNDFIICKMQKSDEGYTYFRESNTVTLTKEEKDIVDNHFKKITMERASKNQSKTEKTKCLSNIIRKKSIVKANPSKCPINITKENNKPKEGYFKENFINITSIENPNDILCFDTETTGFSPTKGDELLEIAITNYNNELVFHSMVKPDFKKSWYAAMKVNYITPQMVKNAPSATSLFPELKELFDNAKVIVGHNVGFDVAFIETCVGYKFDETKLFDTCKYYKENFPNDKHKLEFAIMKFCPEYLPNYQNNAHRADCDTIGTMEVFKSITKDLIKNNINYEITK